MNLTLNKDNFKWEFLPTMRIWELYLVVGDQKLSIAKLVWQSLSKAWHVETIVGFEHNTNCSNDEAAKDHAEKFLAASLIRIGALLL